MDIPQVVVDIKLCTLLWIPFEKSTPIFSYSIDRQFFIKFAFSNVRPYGHIVVVEPIATFCKPEVSMWVHMYQHRTLLVSVHGDS